MSAEGLHLSAFISYICDVHLAVNARQLITWYPLMQCSNLVTAYTPLLDPNLQCRHVQLSQKAKKGVLFTR